MAPAERLQPRRRAVPEVQPQQRDADEVRDVDARVLEPVHEHRVRVPAVLRIQRVEVAGLHLPSVKCRMWKIRNASTTMPGQRHRAAGDASRSTGRYTAYVDRARGAVARRRGRSPSATWTTSSAEQPDADRPLHLPQVLQEVRVAVVHVRPAEHLQVAEHVDDREQEQQQAGHGHHVLRADRGPEVASEPALTEVGCHHTSPRCGHARVGAAESDGSEIALGLSAFQRTTTYPLRRSTTARTSGSLGIFARTPTSGYAPMWSSARFSSSWNSVRRGSPVPVPPGGDRRDLRSSLRCKDHGVRRRHVVLRAVAEAASVDPS